MDDKPTATLGKQKNRRSLLALAGAGGAAAIAALVSRSNGAKAGHDATNVLHLGETNIAPNITHLQADVAGSPVLRVSNGNSLTALSNGIEGGSQVGIGVAGFSQSNIGVQGLSPSGTGVRGASGSGPGVSGQSQSGPGMQGNSQSGTGVQGGSQSGNGVHGNSPSGAGLSGISDSGNGVIGNSQSGPGVHGDSISGIGGHFTTDTGVALRVEGKALFSTAGAGTIPQGQNSVPVNNPAVTPNSHISVTLVSNPGQRELKWVERDPGVGFTVRLTSATPRPATNFTYLIVEPVG